MSSKFLQAPEVPKSAKVPDAGPSQGAPSPPVRVTTPALGLARPGAKGEAKDRARASERPLARVDAEV